ncbi:MAG: hypothetical protein LBK23_05660 [Oscillospiraceae bacterium]|jgi:hypothetical protein|nr:hypothetical protein [Oscillospiraceae bacterium]
MKRFNLIAAILIAAALLTLVTLTVRQLAVGESDARDTPTPPATITPDSQTTPTRAPDSGATPDDTPDIPPPPTLPPVEGDRFTIEAPYGRERLSITVDTAGYTREEMEDGDLYYAKSDESRSVFIEIIFVGDSLSARKPSFLDAYLPGFINWEDLGEVLVASSAVVSEGITVTDGVSTFDAWLIEVDNGFFAVVAGYQTLEQGGELYRMLNTLTFER